MKYNMFLLIGAITLSGLLCSSPSAAEGFKLVKENAFLSLYERWIPGKGANKVRELKAVFTVHSDIPSVIQLLKDQKRGTKWNRNTRAYKVSLTEHKDTWYTYLCYDLPWPFDDQSCYLSFHLKNTGTQSVILFHSISGMDLSEKGVERIDGVRGKWLLEDKKNGAVQISYLITTNRSKNIPRWVSDPIIHSNLFQTMTAFKNILEEEDKS